MSFRFVHTADIHLDSPLKSLALRNEELSDTVAASSRQTFVRIIDFCIEENVDALLIAGDLYDGDQTSMKTARFLSDQLARLDAHNILTFIIKGNHDAESKITKNLVWPDSVKVFGSKAEVHIVNDKDKAVAIHGISFKDINSTENLLVKFKPAIPDTINIGMLHTSLNGSPKHDPYSPCSISELQSTGFDYWALGHIHIRSEVSGSPTIVMPGIPQGRDIGEEGSKSITLVQIENDGKVSTKERQISVAQFDRVQVDVEDATEWNDLIQLLKDKVSESKQSSKSSISIIRLLLKGTSAIAWKIQRDADLLKEELDRIAEGLGNLWVEKIEIEVSALETKGDIAGPLAEVYSVIKDKSSLSESLLVEAHTISENLIKSLPKELRNLLGENEAETKKAIEKLTREGTSEVLSHLQGYK